jgi:hypothetical protein
MGGNKRGILFLATYYEVIFGTKVGGITFTGLEAAMTVSSSPTGAVYMRDLSM